MTTVRSSRFRGGGLISPSRLATSLATAGGDLLVFGTLAVLLVGLLSSVGAAPAARWGFAAGEEPLLVTLRSFDPAEQAGGETFRLARPRAAVIVPIDVPGEYHVALTMRDVPEAAPPRTVQVSLNGAAPATVTLDRTARNYRFQHRVSSDEWAGGVRRALTIYLETDAITAPDRPRPLGVALTGVAIERARVSPSWRAAPLARALILLLVIYAALRCARLPTLLAGSIAGALLAAYGAWAAVARPAALFFAYHSRAQPLQFASVLLALPALLPTTAYLLAGDGAPRGGRSRTENADPDVSGSARRAALAAAAWPALLAGAVGGATIFYRLGARGFWGDEVWEAKWSREQGLAGTFLRFLDQPWHMPLHYMLTHAATSFGRDEWWVRLPSALLGIATIVLLACAGRRLFDPATGAVAALLLAFAPYHIWYAQEARPYAGLSCYALLAFLCYWCLLHRPTRAAWLGFTGATILSLYNHLPGLLPLFAELAAGAAWVVGWWLRSRRPGGTAARDLPRVVAALASSLATILLASLPLQHGLDEYFRKRAPGTGDLAPLEVQGNFLVELLGVLGAGAGWPLWALTALALVGFGVGLSRRRGIVLLAAAWLVVPIGVIALAQPRQLAYPRYFLFMQPVYLLLVAHGLTATARALTALAQRALPARSAGREGLIRTLMSALLAAALGAAFLPITWEGYRVEKTDDWSAICRYLRAQARPGDEVTGNAYADGIIDWCFQDRPEVLFSTARDQSAATWLNARRDVWYVHIATTSPEEALTRGFIPIPRAAWAAPGLLVQPGPPRWFGPAPTSAAAPSTGAPHRFVLPHYEAPVTIYFHRAR